MCVFDFPSIAQYLKDILAVLPNNNIIIASEQGLSVILYFKIVFNLLINYQSDLIKKKKKYKQQNIYLYIKKNKTNCIWTLYILELETIYSAPDSVLLIAFQFTPIS